MNRDELSFGEVVEVVRSRKSTIHRFFDSSPVSPSGRFIALTEFPFEDRLPSPGDRARVVVVDLVTFQEVYSDTTSAWDTQLGAAVQWGGSDSELYYNRMDESAWDAYGVKVNISSGECVDLPGPVFAVSVDGRWSIAPSFEKLGIVQAGYGAHFPNERVKPTQGAPDNDGLFIIDTRSGTRRLLVSFRHLYEYFPEKFRELDLAAGGFYAFVVKWNPQGTRIMLILRWRPSSGGNTKNYLITLTPDLGEIHMPIDAQRWRDGHHPNWCPDGDTIIMNLAYDNKRGIWGRMSTLAARVAKRVGVRYFSDARVLRFSTFRYDGTEFAIAAPSHFGSGHPSMHKDGKHIVTDAYISERVAFRNGDVPIRIINTETDKVVSSLRVGTKPAFSGPRQELRIDPHPAWSRDYSHLVFNASTEGRRSVFMVQVSMGSGR